MDSMNTFLYPHKNLKNTGSSCWLSAIIHLLMRMNLSFIYMDYEVLFKTLLDDTDDPLTLIYKNIMRLINKYYHTPADSTGLTRYIEDNILETVSLKGFEKSIFNRQSDPDEILQYILDYVNTSEKLAVDTHYCIGKKHYIYCVDKAVKPDTETLTHIYKLEMQQNISMWESPFFIRIKFLDLKNSTFEEFYTREIIESQPSNIGQSTINNYPDIINNSECINKNIYEKIVIESYNRMLLVQLMPYSMGTRTEFKKIKKIQIPYIFKFDQKTDHYLIGYISHIYNIDEYGVSINNGHYVYRNIIWNSNNGSLQIAKIFFYDDLKKDISLDLFRDIYLDWTKRENPYLLLYDRNPSKFEFRDNDYIQKTTVTRSPNISFPDLMPSEHGKSHNISVSSKKPNSKPITPILRKPNPKPITPILRKPNSKPIKSTLRKPNSKPIKSRLRKPNSKPKTNSQKIKFRNNSRKTKYKNKYLMDLNFYTKYLKYKIKYLLLKKQYKV